MSEIQRLKEEILKDYPRLTKQHIQAAISYALESIKNEEVYPTISA